MTVKQMFPLCPGYSSGRCLSLKKENDILKKKVDIYEKTLNLYGPILRGVFKYMHAGGEYPDDTRGDGLYEMEEGLGKVEGEFSDAISGYFGSVVDVLSNPNYGEEFEKYMEEQNNPSQKTKEKID